MSISIKELWVVPNVAGRKIIFFNGYGSQLLSPDLSQWAPFLKSCTGTGVNGKPPTCYFAGLSLDNLNRFDLMCLWLSLSVLTHY